MHTNSSSGLNKSKYVPPSQRNSIIPKGVEIPKRKIEKKPTEFSLTDTSLFPTLESSVNKNKTSKPTILSFAAAAKYEEPKKEEK